MATWSKLIDNTITALIDQNGAGTIGESGIVKGRRLPRTSAINALTMLAKISPAIVAAIAKVSYKGQAHRSSIVDDDGTIDEDALILGGLETSISAKAYVAGYPDPNVPYRRSVAAVTAQGITALNTSPLYEPAVESFVLGGEQTDLLAACRESMRDWQAAVNAATALALATPGDLARLQTGPAVDAFWRAAIVLYSGVSSIAEEPVTDRLDVIKGALRDSTNVTTQFIAENAGEFAAAAADTLGKTAGTFADAFLSNAGITALIVAGVAVYLVIP